MNRLKIFNSESQYDLAKDEFVYKTVAYVEQSDEVKWMSVRDKYTREYLTFEALESGTFTLTIPSSVDSTYMTSVSYSTDNGETWTTTTVDNTAQTITTPTINAGDKVLWKGIGKQMSKSTSSNDYSYFSSTGNFNVSGNIMSLLYGDDFQNNTSFNSGSNYNFLRIFRNAAKLTDAVNLILPATTLTEYCYTYMFYGCTALTTAPELPATTLASGCYYGMFKGCTSLTTAPELLATTLVNSCYNQMFYGCTALATAPELPATTLTSSCYHYMFSHCTSLTTAPELPATTLADSCYNGMFSGCAALTTAPVLSSTTLAYLCYGYMFNGCTALTTAPELPATTLASSCYSNMFNGCTALTKAPTLPATTLADSCYRQIFQGCTRLNYIKAMLSGTVGSMQNWVNGVSATGTFIKNSNSTWLTGVNGIPSGWTVETASA